MSVVFGSAAFRPLVTAGAAGVMLCGLSFIPSAHASAHHGETPHRSGQATVAAAAAGRDGAASTDGAAGTDGAADQDGDSFQGQSARASRQLALGASRASDATPYLVGGAGVLCVGAAFVTRAMRRGDGAA
ncbi:hypothetical protein [Streptomyces sp. 8L]|uniref:hypothetical protein n=1 Tax=Streptomyces sp. 8L TaxID=2877242 RepID=UPI001CD2B419|nr:hypothetical protein [Streptomyces sp. 8L]MCA1221563.1 hypothetical protein [Streptomyces sp. 8L]